MKEPDTVACEFVRFCQQRCQLGWPDIYDEMCWVAGHKLFRGMGYDELSKVGMSLGISGMDDTIALLEGINSPSSQPAEELSG